MVQQLRELAAPAEDQSSFCSNHIKWFSHSSSRSRESDMRFWSPWH